MFYILIMCLDSILKVPDKEENGVIYSSAVNQHGGSFPWVQDAYFWMDLIRFMKQNDHLEEYVWGRRKGMTKVELGMYLTCQGDGEEINLAPEEEPHWWVENETGEIVC